MIKSDDGNENGNVEKSDDVAQATFDEAFEMTGHGKFNYIVLLTSGLILLNVSMESVGISYVISAAECDLALGSKEKGIINAAAFIGITSSSLVWGHLADRCGRRAVMVPALVVSAILSLMSAFATDVWMLFILRVLTGCFVSASSATIYAYLGETHTSGHRGAAIAWGSSFISFSFMILPGLAWAIIPGTWSLWLGSLELVPWRAFIAVWCVPGLLAAIALIFLPESPKFELTRRGPDQALVTLARIFASNYNTTPDTFPIKKIMVKFEEVAQPSGFLAAIKNIGYMFKPPLLKCVLISHLSMFTVFMVSSGMYMWVPDILNSLLTSSDNEGKTLCKILQAKIAQSNLLHANPLQDQLSCQPNVSVVIFPISMAMGAVFSLTYLAIGFFIDRVGRKKLYCITMFLCGAAAVGAGFVPHGVVATALLIVALCSGCAGSILAAISVDVFPTNFRAMAMCIMYMVGRSGAAVGANILGSMLDEYCLTAFTFFGAFTAGSSILMLFWPKSDKVREVMESKGFTY